ncbi:hypothetical protein [Vallicoccus soli]|uniref:GH26 domain-containing protein n=1 Tax=Vallicoccus soli TaxID=2339232 RepID=A0A3A3Z9Y0_9ACTN|nr:hypothetical protein [Vallicoccus soli]RJK97896.1 hypothetical protein D5H78_02710 [Vallicoccus soli]
MNPATGPLLDRRQLLRLSLLGAAGTVLAGAGATALAAPAAAAARWPGHQPGRIYLGGSGQLSAVQDQLGLARTYYKWGDGTRETRNITAAHRAGRLPWISFKPPSGASWSQIASGRYDADLRARARRYAQLGGPVVATFNHEPHTDVGHLGTSQDFARAWCRVHDVMRDETGLRNVASVPILGDWTFNPVNRRDSPEGYLSGGVLDRAHFLGIDLYQNRSGDGYEVRLGRILGYLDARGRSDLMVGVGETGATDGYRDPSGAEWWTSSWDWAAARTSRIGAISYFSSLHNNNSGNNWLLTESATKLAAFRRSLTSSTACRL